MIIRIMRFCAILMLLGVAKLNAEVRAMWVLPWSMTSTEQVDAYVNQAIRARQTDLLIEVRYRSDALYRPNRGSKKYPNPEPRSYILPNNSFDPLEYTLRKAHRHNLRVHAWVVVFNATPLQPDLVAKNHIYRNHYDWITHDRQGNKMNTGAQFGFFIDPGIPAVQDYLLNVFSDLITGYPELDGLHLDYIRYPNNDLGYHPISEERFREYNRSNPPITWQQWRIRQITGFVEKIYNRAKELNPHLNVSAAVFANYADAVNLYAQEWKDWLDRGIIDHIYPMAYHLDFSVLESQLNLMRGMGYKDKIIVGLRAWNANGGSLVPRDGDPASAYNVFDVANRITLVRRMRFLGLALFSYDGLIKDGGFDMLSELAFTDGALDLPGDGQKLLTDASEDAPNAVDLSVSIGPSHYLINMLIPVEGMWNWEVRALDERIVYRRKAFYIPGSNQDYWNGITDEGDILPSGAYLIGIYRDQDPYEYLIHVQMESLGYSNER